ncbi:restriction endonuclease subunit S [Lactococcus cremoris]|uniref:restriction endonuclease subunit S n=1 Tax=Lactococcus lactis subsp. cremoris TaxID=1359 RepID=UPI001EED1E19|nr:restriction endonuclease subunit S [Lactococcus cremoris]ARE24825.2 restriction endonuclease subunit S [Lactococcus cremoris]
MNFKNLSEVSDYVNERVKVENLTVENYISTENMLPNKGGIDKAIKLPAAKTTSLYSKGDILLSNIRTYFKKIWYAEKDGGCSNDVLVVRARGEIEPKFLYYVLSNDKFFEYSSATSKGTKMPRGDKSAIMQYQIPDMPLEDQRTIVSVLSALDDRIAENKKINHHLAEIIDAQFDLLLKNNELFKSSFSEIGEIIGGGTPSKKVEEYWNGNIPWLSPKDLSLNPVLFTDKGQNSITNLGYKKSSAKLMPRNSILFSSRAPIGYITIAENEISTNQGFKSIVPRPEYPYTFVYELLKQETPLLESSASGSTFKEVSGTQLKNHEIKIPSECVIAEFHQSVEPLFEAIKLNEKEIQTLAETRDMLLPKLMSGKLSVNQATK